MFQAMVNSSIFSQRRLISTESTVKISTMDDEIIEDSKKKKSKVKAQKVPPKMIYRYPGCCVGLLRVILSFWNLIMMTAGLGFIM